MNEDYTITFACYNQLEYTKRFIDSLCKEEVNFSRIVAVDNGSSDGTYKWLQDQGFGCVILNKKNLGCGVAWNQGILALQSTWTVIMNNDVICGKNWLRNLINQATLNRLQIASPAMVEGTLNYSLTEWTESARKKLGNYYRPDAAHAVCMAVHEDVWSQTGYFMPVPRLLGYEDHVFFRRCVEENIKMGVVGSSWLHHYGMTTQKAMKLEKHMSAKDSLGDRNLMQKFLKEDWLARKLSKFKSQKSAAISRENELKEYGITIHGVRFDGQTAKWH
jgi:GT2 family glycosyltransferase